MAKADDAFFTLFKDRWKLANEAEKEQRQNEIADLEFEAGQHWDPKVKADRERDGKPALTIDLLSGPIKLVTNQQRLARPGIDITAVNINGTKKKAEYWQGYLRRVERLSGAGRVYSWAGQHQAKMGRGFWAVRNVYVGEGFEQESRLEELDNQHTAYCDPNTKKLDGSDKRWAIRWCDYTHEEYKDRFGESKLGKTLNDGHFRGIGDSPPEWITPKHCRVGEYYYLETESREKWLLSDGSEVWADEIDTEAGRDKGKFAKVPKLPEGVTIKLKRDVTRDRVKFCFINGMGEKLEETTIPGEFIPIVRVYGERRNIDGKVDYRGLVRMAKDPNRMEDFCESSLMEAISLAKTAPWLAEWDQISEFAQLWQTSNRVNYAVLPYKKVILPNGQALERPARVQSGVDVTALTLAAQRMQNHVRNVTGNADVFQEETRQEQSGRAIRERKLNQELSTADYMENLGDGIVLTAKIIMSQARDMLDTPRVVVLYGNDQNEQPVVIHNGPDQLEAAQMLAQQHQIQELFDVSGTRDDYDIAVTPGKRSDTARQETVEILGELIPRLVDPQMQRDATITLVKNMDGAGMTELASKWDPDTDQKIPPQVQAELQALRQQLQEAAEIIRTDQVKQQAQIEVSRDNNLAKLAIEKMQQDAAIAIARMKMEAEKAMALFEARVGRISEQEGREHESNESRVGRGHEWAMAQAAADHADRQLDREAAQTAMQTDREAVHASVQAEQGHQHALEQGEQQATAAIQQIKAKPKPTNGKGGR